MAEKSTDAVREWTKNNLERRREMNRRAAKAFYARKKENDPEYMEKRREYYAVKMRKKYKPTSEMTEEELEKQRAYKREQARKYRERKKAAKLAQAAEENKGTV